MKTLKKIGKISILILFFVLIVGRLISNKKYYEKELALMQGNQIEVPVTICSPEYIDFKESFSATGTFKAQNTVNVVAETSGRILEFLVNEGMYISRNVVIANIQNDVASKDFELAKLNFEKAKRDFNRYRNLKTGEAVSENKMEEVELALKNAETTHTYAKERLDKTEILSPICGYITKVYAKNGHFVSPGQPVLEITDIDKVKISVNLPSEQLKKLDKDTEISLTCASFPNITIHGSIFCIGRKANASGRFPVTLIMKNNQLNTLLPGMIGTVSFNMPPKATFVIPRSTLTGSVKTPEVFIVNQGYAIKKTISAIPLSSEYIQVLDGLKEDDSVVLSGQFNLSDSAKVRIVSNTKI